MELNSIAKITEKAKKFTQTGFANIFKLPMHKILLGTAVTIIPGALVLTGAYFLSNRFVKKYRNYKSTQELPKGFMKWASIEATEGIKTVSIMTGQGIVKSTRGVSKLMSKSKKKS